MSIVKVFDDKDQLAHAAAETATGILRSYVETYGEATWVLAGGSTPLAAYQAIMASFADALDWSKVTLLIGDERIGGLEEDTNNWHAIDKILSPLPTRKLRPKSNLSAEEAADDYASQLSILPKVENGLPRLDLVWLGVGDDGHTLSLFPNHDSLFPSSSLVIPVHNSPKPPHDRISLSLRALQGAANAMVLASGAEKHAAVQAARGGNNSPISLAISIIETHEGNVTWFVDRDAASTD